VDDESGESMEPMEEVSLPIARLGKSELERLVSGGRRERGRGLITAEFRTVHS